MICGFQNDRGVHRRVYGQVSSWNNVSLGVGPATTIQHMSSSSKHASEGHARSGIALAVLYVIYTLYLLSLLALATLAIGNFVDLSLSTLPTSYLLLN